MKPFLYSIVYRLFSAEMPHCVICSCGMVSEWYLGHCPYCGDLDEDD